MCKLKFKSQSKITPMSLNDVIRSIFTINTIIIKGWKTTFKKTNYFTFRYIQA